MSSTDLDAPPFKLIFMAIIIVVGLHVLTAMALVAVKTPEMKIEPEKERPPIEIKLVTPPPPPVEVEIETLKIEDKKPEPVRQVKSQPQPKAKPKPKSTPDVKPKPRTLEKPIIKDKKADVAPLTEQEQKKPVIIKKVLPKKPTVEPTVNTSIADEQRRIIAAQAEKSAQEAQAKAIQEANAKAIQEANAKAARDAQAEEAAARAKAEVDAKAAAASNEPVSFSGKDAAWITPPNFQGISDKVQTLTLRFIVTKQGSIENIKINGTENVKIDREVRRRLKRSKIKPFIQNGTPVVGAVTLSIEVKP